MRTYRELVRACAGGDGVVYELMRDAEMLCQVIRPDLLQVDPAAAAIDALSPSWPYTEDIAASVTL